MKFIEELMCEPILIESALESFTGTENGRQSLIPIQLNYKNLSTAILNKWESSRNWERLISECGDDVSMYNVFINYAAFLKDYLLKHHTQSISEILEGIHTGDITENPTKYRFELYAAMLFDDFLITPGVRDIASDKSQSENNDYLFTSVLKDQYDESLQDKLTSGLDDEVLNPPAGNNELGELIKELIEDS
tara:strand:- start:14 stop:589 length:576 start_codon:yes stop_codon:yes gene_type:complete